MARVFVQQGRARCGRGSEKWRRLSGGFRMTAGVDQEIDIVEL